MKYKCINKGTFVGYADFYFPDIKIEIFSCTLHKKDEKRWVNLPVRAYKDQDGQEKYSPIIRFRDQDQFHDFCVRAKVAIDAFNQKDLQNG